MKNTKRGPGLVGPAMGRQRLGVPPPEVLAAPEIGPPQALLAVQSGGPLAGAQGRRGVTLGQQRVRQRGQQVAFHAAARKSHR